MCLSVWFYVSLRARCHWSTVFYLRKGSKTPEATSDLARLDKNRRKRSTSPGAAIVQGALRVDAHTHTPRAMWEKGGVEFFHWHFQFPLSNFLTSAGFEPWLRVHDRDECAPNISRSNMLTTTL